MFFLCLLAFFFNCIIIASIWSSSQLRKTTCYFMILVLSCFDLAVATITHPLIISSAVEFSHENDVYHQVKKFIAVSLHGWSTLALFIMTVERFLSLAYPIFHRTTVTRGGSRKILFDRIKSAVELCNVREPSAERASPPGVRKKFEI